MAVDDSESQLPGLPGYDAQNLQPWTVQVIVAVTALALVAVGLRLFSRRLKSQQLWLDDKMIIFSMVRTRITNPPTEALDQCLLTPINLVGLEPGCRRLHLCHVQGWNGPPRGQG
jgi:hypothetical protein